MGEEGEKRGNGRVYVPERLRDPGSEPPRRGLVVREPWASRLLAGTKVWEIRGRSTRIRGPIALIAGGSKTVIGVLDMVDVVGPLSAAQYAAGWLERGGCADDGEPLPYPSTYARVVRNPWALLPPVPYVHRRGPSPGSVSAALSPSPHRLDTAT